MAGLAPSGTRRALLAAALAGLAAPALGQAYPDRPVRVVVPFSPGGNVDKITRLLAVHWSERLRQPCVVENRAGAGGTLAATLVAQAKPDGYTLLAGGEGNLFYDPQRPGVVIDPLRSFAPVGLMERSHTALIVGAGSPWQTLGALVAEARARPGRLSVGHPGIGSGGQSVIRQMARAGVEVTEVAYRGGGEAVADVIAGHVDALAVEIATLLPLHQAGQGRILGVAAERRIAGAPALPTFIEQGFPGLVEGAFVGLLAPFGTPEPALQTLSAALAASIAAPGMAEEFARLAVDPPAPEQVTPQGLAQFLAMRRVRAERSTARE